MSRARALRATLQRSASAILGVVVLLGVGGAALAIGRSNLSSAEQDRLHSRVQTVDGLAGNVSDQAVPRVSLDRVQATPFSEAPGGLNQVLIKQFHTSDDPAALTALVTLDGRTLAAEPAGATVDPALFGNDWQDALAGTPVLGDTVRYNGAVSSPTLAPVGSPTWGMLVMLKPALNSADQAFMEQIGSLNGKPGGIVVTDRKGVVYTAWSSSLIGTRQLSPQEVAGLPDGAAEVWTRQVDGEEWTLAGRQVGDGMGLLFEQRTDDLFGDLRASQRQRDMVLLSVLGAALVALVAFQLARELSARRAEARVHTLLRNSQDLIVSATTSGTLRFVSPAIEALLGQPAEAWQDRDLAEVCHPDDADRLARLLADPDSGPLLNVRFSAEDGSYRYFDIEARDLRRHPEVGGVLLTCHEVGQRKQLEDELNRQATHDRLTGLPNRAELGARLEQLVRDGRPTLPFALLYLDLDHFKPVNDTMGHDAGDEVLVTVSNRLREAAGPDAFVSRLGGDEFAVLLEGADERRAVAAAQALRDAARAPVAVGSRLAHLDASIGIALTDPGSALTTAEQLVRWADQAMYQAKRNGRGRWSIAVPSVTAAEVAAARTHRSRAHRPDDEAVLPTAPEFADFGEADGTPDRPSLRRRLASAVPIMVAVAIVLAIAGVGFRQSLDDQRGIERELLDRHMAFVSRGAAFYSSVNDTAPLTRAASNAPWMLDGGAVDDAVLKAFATNSTVGTGAVAVLATVDGQVLTSYPEGTPLTIAPSERIWREAALFGKGNQVSSVHDPDEERSYFVIPVLREGKPAAVLALGLSLRHGPGQSALEKGGFAGYTTGGWSEVNADGIVFMSWNPALIGTRLVDPRQLTGIAPGTTRDLTTDEQVLMVSPMTSTIDPTYMVFAMPAADFMRDLRIGQVQRVLAFVGVLATAVLGLAFVNHRRELAVRRSQARLDALLQQAHDVVIVLDEDGRTTFVSSAVHRLLGFEPADHMGQPIRALIHPVDRDRALAVLGEAHARGSAVATDVRVSDASGDYHWFDLHAVDLRTNPEVSGVLVTAHEVTERRELQEQLAYRAQHDPLTGLPNRARLGQQLAELASAEPPAPFAVLFVDLDHFKPVNDALGHDAGDAVLRTVAERFAACVRVEGGDLVCRLGGDEFAVVLRNTTEAIARATAERLLEAARQPIEIGDDTVHISATIGISQSHPDRQSPDIAVRHADLAMYRAKESGRGRYEMFDPSDAGFETDTIDAPAPRP